MGFRECRGLGLSRFRVYAGSLAQFRAGKFESPSMKSSLLGNSWMDSTRVVRTRTKAGRGQLDSRDDILGQEDRADALPHTHARISCRKLEVESVLKL